jgi:hypothetical protein
MTRRWKCRARLSRWRKATTAGFPLFTPTSTASTTPRARGDRAVALAGRRGALIEWPERAGDALPEDRIDIAFSHRPALGSTARAAEITGHGKAAAIVARLKRCGSFSMPRAFWMRRASACRRCLDALLCPAADDNGTAILMNSPAPPDGPPIYDGRSYSAAVHLAEDVKPFVAIANGCASMAFSAPAIRHSRLLSRDF